jgi:hypothetical protein
MVSMDKWHQIRIMREKGKGIKTIAIALGVSKNTVRMVLVKHHLNRISLPPVKPIKRFEARHPNELWQIDIMGEVTFPLVGICL